MNSIVTRRRSMLHGGGTNVTYLYNEGDECTSIGGSWVFPTIVQRTQDTLDWHTMDNYAYESGGMQVSVLRQKNSNNIQLDATLVRASQNAMEFTLSVHKQNKIDLSPYSKLYVNIDTESDFSSAHDKRPLKVSIMTQSPNQVPFHTNVEKYWNVEDINPSKIYEFDISDVNKSAYICLINAQFSTMTYSRSKIYKVWLE